jgi:hypothetical protein
MQFDLTLIALTTAFNLGFFALCLIGYLANNALHNLESELRRAKALRRHIARNRATLSRKA